MEPKALIRQFRANLAQLQDDLKPLEAREQKVFSDRVNVTGKHIAGLQKGIAEYERLIRVLERDSHDS
jgi:hypothetical protein